MKIIIEQETSSVLFEKHGRIFEVHWREEGDTTILSFSRSDKVVRSTIIDLPDVEISERDFVLRGLNIFKSLR